MIRSGLGTVLNHHHRHPDHQRHHAPHPHRSHGSNSHERLHGGVGAGWAMEPAQRGAGGSTDEDRRPPVAGRASGHHHPPPSPFSSAHPHAHHPVLTAAGPSPFDELDSDPVASSSMDSSEEDRKLPAAVGSDAPAERDPTGAAAGPPVPRGRRDRRDGRRHSLSRDPFEGLTARLFPSDESPDLDDAMPAAEGEDDEDDDDREDVAHRKPPPFHRHEEPLAHPADPFYAAEIGPQLFDDPALEMHHSLLHPPSLSFAAAAGPSPGDAFGSGHQPSMMPPPHPFQQHHPLSPPPFHHGPHRYHGGQPSDPLSTPVQAIPPPPQIYRFGHSAPPAYGRHPPFDPLTSMAVGYSDPASPDPFLAYQLPHHDPILRQHHRHQEHQESDGDGELEVVDEEAVADRTSVRPGPARKRLPAKRSSHAKRNIRRPASASSSRIGQPLPAAGSAAGRGGSGRAGAGESTRSGERTSQVRHSPTDEEIAEAKTPRARAALQNWYARLADLLEYKAEHGDCNVPQKYDANPALGIWVNKQRMEKKFMDEDKKTSMTPSKLRALEEVGFAWAKRKGQPSWDRRYSELVQYRNEHGDCNVPTKYAANPALGRWVSTQRSQYKQLASGHRTQMTGDRMARLSAIGFRWNMTDRELEESRHLPLLSSGSGDEMEV